MSRNQKKSIDNNISIHLLCSEKSADVIKENADKCGLTMEEYMLDSALKGARRRRSRDKKICSEIAKITGDYIQLRNKVLSSTEDPDIIRQLEDMRGGLESLCRS